METKRMKDQQTKSRFVELRAKGWSYDRIARELRASKQTLINWSKEYSLQISNLRNIEIEALQEKFCLLKEQRIELFGKKLKTNNEELDKRDFKDIPTEKLFDLIIKYASALKHEEVEMVFEEEISDIFPDWKKVSSWKG